MDLKFAKLKNEQEKLFEAAILKIPHTIANSTLDEIVSFNLHKS